MLTNLFINNIVLIDKLDISLSNGFCVLTGETGAGKSILLDALGLALGERASAALIRSGERQGSVMAAFYVPDNSALLAKLDENGIASDGEIFLRRVLYHDGKTKAFINDVPVSVTYLAEIAGDLIEIHGQHDQRGLLDPKTHRLVIDEYGRTDGLLNEVESRFRRYKLLKTSLENMLENQSKAHAEEEYLKFVLKELNELAPKAELEAELAGKRNSMLNREKLIEAVNQASSHIGGNDIDAHLSRAQNILADASQHNEKFSAIAQMIERASIEISEAINELQLEASKIEESEDNLEAIEERLFALRNAARKYQTPIDELEQYQNKIAEKLDMLENKEQHLSDLKNDVEKARENYIQKAEDLSAARVTAAKKLEEALSHELKPLKMESTKLQVNIEQLPVDSWSANGIDKIAFLVRTNPGSPFAPIGKIASGGELSRFMLALKVALSDVKSVPTMIFDEVDTGIGGAVADAVGRRLEALGQKLQVFAITHQPQVAARGKSHLKVQKTQSADGTTTTVVPLSQKARQEELARMLAGDTITGEARAAAARLLQEEVA